MGKTLEDGVDLGQVSETLEKVGVEVLNSEGKMNSVGDIMEDLMAVWSELDTTQKNAIATTLAGKYQLSRFNALMNRSDMYDEFKSASENADGTMDEMNQKYLDSLEGKLKTLQATFEDLINSFATGDDFTGLIGGLTQALQLMTDLIDAIGGGSVALQGLGAIATKVFSSQLADGIQNIRKSFGKDKLVKEKTEAVPDTLKQMGVLVSEDDALSQKFLDFATQSTSKLGIMSEEQQNKQVSLMEQTGEALMDFQKREEEVRTSVEATNKAYELRNQLLNIEGRVPKISKFEGETDAEKAERKAQGIPSAYLFDQVRGLPTKQTLTEGQLNQIKDSSAYQNVVKGYEKTSSVLNQYKTKLLEIQNLVKTSPEGINVVDPEDIAQVQKLAQELRHVIAELQEAQLMTEGDVLALGEGSEHLKGVYGGSKKHQERWGQNNIEQYDAAIENLGLLEDLVNKQRQVILDSTDVSKVYQNASDGERAQQKRDDAYTAAAGTLRGGEEFLGDLDDKNTINNVLDLAGALGEVAFAVQGIQNLGPIWENDDLTLIEKIGSSFLNLAMVAPVVVDGIRSMTVAMKALGASTKMLGGIGAILGLVGGAIALFEGEMARLDQIQDNQISQAENARAELEEAQTSYNNWEPLYKEYQEKGVVSEEFKNASSEIVAALGDESDAALLAAGQYDALAESIKAKTDASTEEALMANRNVLDGETGRKLKGEQHVFQKSLSDRYSQFYNNATGSNAPATAGAINQNIPAKNSYIKDLLGDYKELEEQDVPGTIRAIREAEKTLSDEQARLQTTPLSERGEEWKQQYQDVSDTNAQLLALKDENYDEEYKALEGQATTGAQLDSFQQKLAEAGDDAQAIQRVFAEDMNTSGYFSTLISDAERLNFLLANINDEGQKMALLGEEAQMGLTQFSNVYAKGQGKSDEEANAFADDIYAKIEDSGIEDEQLIELKAGIDAEDFIQNIDEIIAMAQGHVDSKEIIAKFSTEDDFSENPEDYMDAERHSRVVDEYEVSEDTIETYRELQKESTALYDEEEDLISQKKEAAQAAKEIKDSLGEESAEYKKAKKEVDRAEKSLTAYTNTQEDLVDMSIQSQKGLERLSKNIDKNGDILKKGNKNTLEYAEAMDDTREAVADLVNLSKEDISPQFVLDNFEDIEKAASGDLEAIERLRVAAANEVLVRINQEGNLTPESLEYLQQKAFELSGLNIEAYASLEDQAFIDSLNNMIASGEMTAADVQSYLNSIGYDPVIEDVSTTSKMFTVPATNIPFKVAGFEIGGLEIPSINIEGQVSMPRIKSIQSTGGGSHNPLSSVGGGGGRGGGGGGGRGGGGRGGGGRGGGGGGSGSGKTYEPKKKDLLEEETDRYERVETLLDSIENEMDKVADEFDRITGFQIQDNMEKQVALIKRQVELHKQKLEIQKQEVQELRNELSQYGIGFDSEGFISNYQAIHQQLIDNVRSLQEQYNNTTTEEGQNQLEKQIEEAEKRLDKFKEKYERYDELWAGDIKETEKAIEDLFDTAEDLAIEVFEKSIEAADNIKDIQEQLVEFNMVFTGLRSDDPFRGIAESTLKIKNYFDVATDSVNEFYDNLIKRSRDKMNQEGVSDEQKKWLQQQIDSLEKAKQSAGNQTVETHGTGFLDMQLTNMATIMEQIRQFEKDGAASIFGENSADLYEIARDVFDAAASAVLDLEKQIEDLQDSILDAIDEIGDSLDRRAESFQNINDELEHQLNIMEMIHGDKAYDKIGQLLGAQNEVQSAQIKEQMAQLDYWKNLLKEMNPKVDSEEWKAIQDKIVETQKNVNDLVESSLETLQRKYENTVNSILDTWTNNAFGGDDLDWVNTEWELINRNASYYLDETNKAYSIQKLQGKYLQMLDNANGLHIQQQITEQMNQQLKYLRDKKNLSEYDVAYANAQLEILQKRLALEEAERNKSQMKLKRDSQGNYSYVYTANKDDLAGAKDELLDAQNNAYNMAKDQMVQTQTDSLSALQDAKAMLAQIWTDANLSLEEKTKRTKVIMDSLKEYLNATSEQLSTAEEQVIESFIGMVDMTLEENKDGLQGIYDQIVSGNKDAFDQIDTRWSTSISSWLQNLDSFNTSTETALGQLTNNFTTTQENIAGIGTLVNQDFNDVSAAITDTKGKMDELVNSTGDFYKTLNDNAGTLKQAEADLKTYREKLADVTNEMKAYKNQVNDLASKLTKKEQENANLQNTIDDLRGQLGIGGGGGSGSGNGSLSDGAQVGDWVGYKGWYYYDSWGKKPAGHWGEGQAGAVKIDGYSAQRYGGSASQTGDFAVHLTGSNGWDLGWVKESQLFDTGGYTGNWGSGEGLSDAKNGKMAILHNKELVLNSSDTENILRAVEAVREITSQFKSGLISRMTSLAQEVYSSADKKTNRDTIQQEVHITAEFPNVNSASEIEQALLSLNDTAAQYTKRIR